MDAIDASSARLNSCVALLRGEAFGQRPREARDHARIARKQRVRLVARVASRERDHTQHLRMPDEIRVEIVDGRNRELQHHLLLRTQGIEVLEEGRLEEPLRALLVRRVDVDLGLDDRHEAGRQDPAGRSSNCWATTSSMPLASAHFTTERILVPNTPLPLARASSASRSGHRLHQLHAVRLVGQALVDLQEWHHLLHGPQVVGTAPALDLAVHRLLEQDRAQDAIAVERRAGDDPRAHRVDQVEHLLLARIGILLEAVQAERLRRAAATLIERGDEASGGLELLVLLRIHGGPRGGMRKPDANFTRVARFLVRSIGWPRVAGLSGPRHLIAAPREADADRSQDEEVAGGPDGCSDTPGLQASSSSAGSLLTMRWRSPNRRRCSRPALIAPVARDGRQPGNSRRRVCPRQREAPPRCPSIGAFTNTIHDSRR